MDGEHRETVGDKGISNELFALVHHPVPLDKAMQIPEAIAAIGDEWTKLEIEKFVDYSDVWDRVKLK